MENKGKIKEAKLKEKEWYKEEISKMLNQIEDVKFLNQIRTIIKRHLQK